MSSTSSLPEISHTGVRRRRPALRIVYYFVCFLLVVVLAGVWWLYWEARRPLPQLDGAVSVPGISARVRVIRDERGVPTIEASSLQDLFFAQGYVTAQDRLWQMDMMRRSAAGELSEVIGAATVKMDREERTLGLRQAEEAAQKSISARDRVFFEAYARGVNAFIESHRDRLSLEFRLMKYTPRPWTVTDSMLIGARMVQDLNHYSYRRALEREKILAKLGPELTADLYVNSSWRDRPPTEMRRMDEDNGADSDGDDDDDEEVEPEGGSSRITSAHPGGLGKKQVLHFSTPTRQKQARWGPRFAQDDNHFSSASVGVVSKAKDLLFHQLQRQQVLRFAQDDNSFISWLSSDFVQEENELFRAGSNDWVVSGQHTVSGKPLLSNDMHLNHQMPNLWFAAHLRVIGGTNRATNGSGNGGTNAGTDLSTKAVTNTGNSSPHDSTNFDVAGVTLPGVPFVIVGHNQRIGWGFTNVGPTVEDDFVEEFNAQGEYKTPAGWIAPVHRAETIHVKGAADVTFDVVTTRHGTIISELIPGETREIALRWTLQDGEGLVFFDVDSARNWDEFRKAFSTFGAPGQNVMYADVDGHIGYQATGRVPIRAAGDGSLPVSGSDDAHEWKSWIPYDEMPHIYDPPSGILATANGRITPTGYKYSISTEWDAPWRTDRIYRVLESGKRFAAADMLALEMDVSSTYDRFCADKFVYAIDHAAGAPERVKKAADILRDWDGRMSAEAAAPTIETKARQELVRLLLEPKLGAAASEPENGALNWKTYRWAMSSVWLENVLTKQPTRWLPSGYADYGSLLTAAMENVVGQSRLAAGDPSRDHAAAPADLNQWKWGKNYPVEIDHLVLRNLPLIGRFTAPGEHPMSGSTSTVKQVARGFGPSERLTMSFADFDESTLNLVTGESGIFLSPYYMDQWAAWYKGSTFALPFSQKAVEGHRAHEMTLEPK